MHIISTQVGQVCVRAGVHMVSVFAASSNVNDLGESSDK